MSSGEIIGKSNIERTYTSAETTRIYPVYEGEKTYLKYRAFNFLFTNDEISV